jgi:hypothetical protein
MGFTGQQLEGLEEAFVVHGAPIDTGTLTALMKVCWSAALKALAEEFPYVRSKHGDKDGWWREYKAAGGAHLARLIAKPPKASNGKG